RKVLTLLEATCGAGGVVMQPIVTQDPRAVGAVVRLGAWAFPPWAAGPVPLVLPAAAARRRPEGVSQGMGAGTLGARVHREFAPLGPDQRPGSGVLSLQDVDETMSKSSQVMPTIRPGPEDAQSGLQLHLCW